MKDYKQLLFLISFFSMPIVFAQSAFQSHIQHLSPELKQSIEKYSWHAGCPVNPSELSDVQVSYWGFDGSVHTGEIIVHHRVANEVVTIFQNLYEQKFPIYKMVPIEAYQGSDKKAMLDNDTSAFLCRKMTRKPHRFSTHSYGMAIDINPLQNPYVIGNYIEPPPAKAYLNRAKKQKGMVVKGDVVVQTFNKHGWKWGGDWRHIKDYQHFEKLR